MVIENTLTVGMFMAFNAYRGSFSSRMGSLIDVVFSFKMLPLHRERIADIALTEAENEIYHPQPTENSNSQQGAAISVKNLAFRYDPFSEPVFTNLNLSIKAGESVAISAKSGFGKTTLLKLMAGLLKPTKGEIYFNNLDINQLGLANYRQYIGFVLQDDKFFSGSILENIVSFEEKYNREFAIECAKLAQIHDEIMAMPMNY